MEKIEETIDKICKSRIWEFIFVLIYPMLILFITENIGEMYLNDKIIRIKVMFESEAYLLILNTIIAPYIFIILISLFFRSISKNSFISNIIISIICLLTTTISYYKMRILGVPLLATDVFLVKDIMQIAGYGSLVLSTKTIGIVLSIVLLLLAQFFILRKQEKKSKIDKKEIIIRIICAVVTFAILASACISTKTGGLLGMINNKQYEFSTKYNSYGANFMFFKSIANLFPQKVEWYSKEKISEMQKETESKEEKNNVETTVKPNVIAIMSESLFDITKAENLEISEDPLKNLKEISSQYYSGNIVSPSYAGGTSVPEFEFLTGLTSNFFEPNTYPYSQYMNGNINSIVRNYKNNNYECIAVHPNGGNFYNRDVAYELIGFDKKVFIDDMDVKTSVRNYVSDDDFANQIIKTYENASEEQNKFIFGVSIQNHRPYEYTNYDKYDITINFKNVNISEEDKKEILAYTQGVYDADKAIKKIIEYFKNVEEPTIVVIFGDHLPGIDSLEEVYYKEDNLKKHQTVYCVYSNYDIERQIKFEENMSAANLALKISEMANLEIPWYYKYIQSIYEKYPVITNQFIMDNNNILYTSIEDDKIKNYQVLQYDLLHKRKYIPVH